MNLWPLSLRSSPKLLSFARRKCLQGKYPKALPAVDLVMKRLAASASSSEPTLESYSQTWEALLLKGHILRNLGETGAATVAFLLAYKLLPIDDDALEFLAAELLRDGDLGETARTVYLDYLAGEHSRNPRRNKTNLQLLESLSAPQWKQGESFESTLGWNQIICQRRPDLAWPHRHIGAIAIAWADWDTAVDSLQQAHDLERSNTKTLQDLAYALFRVARFQDAKTYLDRLISGQPRNSALLLRAHVHRGLKNFAAAVRDFRRVSELNALTDEERLSYAEVCINAGYLDEAAKELWQLYWYYDARWLLLSALVDEAEERYDQALTKLDQVIAMDLNLAFQAVPRVLNLLARNPELPDGREILDAIPAEYRDDSYWIIKGNILLALGRTQQAFEAWLEVAYLNNEQFAALASLERYHLATLYNQNRDLDIIRLLRKELLFQTDSDEIAEIIVSSLSRFVCKNLNVTFRPEKFFKDIELIETWFPGSADADRLELLRALVHTACGHYEEAAQIFSQLPPSTNDEINLQVARCAIHNGAWLDCLETLNCVDRKNRQANRIRCALSALHGNWEAAGQYLSRLPSQTDLDKFNAAILFRTGKWTELQNLNGSARYVADYYRIAHHLQCGNDQLAAELLASIPPHDPHRVLSNWLFGWRQLQPDQSRITGDQCLEDTLLAALTLWPDGRGPASCVKNLNVTFMRALLLNEKALEAFGAVLEADARSSGPTHSASCHNLGLFHFCSGIRYAADDNFEGTFESWQKAIAYIAVALADEDYMAQWIGQRLQSYGIDQHVETRQIVDQVARHYDATFKKTSEELANRSRPVESGMVSDLVLALWSELNAARALKTLGGFDIRVGSEKVGAGPIFISMMDEEHAFAAFLSNLKLRYAELPEDLSDDPVAALWQIVENWKSQEAEGALDPSTKERLEKLYSVLRFAVVRHEENNLESALKRLREARSSFRVPATLPRPKSRACAAVNCVNLAQRNPAFARKGGRRDFLSLAKRYEIELLTLLGEHDVASIDNRVDSGIEYWREALSLAQDTGEYVWVTQKIQEVGIGRAQFLHLKNDLPEAIALLEQVNELCGDEEVGKALSKLIGVRGVRANNNGELEVAVQDLRYAVSLCPHSVYTQFNLAIILHNLAGDVLNDNPERAQLLLEEALEAINVCRDVDGDNEQYWETQSKIKDDLNWLRFELG